MSSLKLDYRHIITEIFLVTIGILIAIQIDSAYNDRQVQKEINSYLIDIDFEFETEMFWQQNKMSYIDNQLKYLNAMTRIILNQETDSLGYLVGYAEFLGENNAVDFYDFPILDEFIKLEYLNKIEDDSLRLWIKEYSKIVGYTQDNWEYSTQQDANVIQPFLFENFLHRDIFPDPLFDDKITPKKLRKSYKNLFNNTDFFNIISLKRQTIKSDRELLNSSMKWFGDIRRNIIRYNKDNEPKPWIVKAK